jgi:hypothetical protein
MPVDDLLVWAAEQRSYGSSKATTNNTKTTDEPQSCINSRSITAQPPSPSPKRHLPRWFDVGHCPAACSSRCSLHAAEREKQDVATNGTAPPWVLAESSSAHQRRHRRSFQGDDNLNLRLSSSTKPTKLEGRYNNSRLDSARLALLNGDTAFARSIVAAELDRLGISEGI